MPGEKLKQLLDARGIPYEVLPHSQAFSAQKTAETLHVHGGEFAKPVVLRANGRRIMAVVPAPMRVDLERMGWLAGGRTLEILPESELTRLFPDDELGAMSPLGSFYGLLVLLDRRLAQRDSIVFNAGSHSEAIRVRVSDFLRLVGPTIADFATPAEPAQPDTGGHP